MNPAIHVGENITIIGGKGGSAEPSPILFKDSGVIRETGDCMACKLKGTPDYGLICQDHMKEFKITFDEAAIRADERSRVVDAMIVVAEKVVKYEEDCRDKGCNHSCTYDACYDDSYNHGCASGAENVVDALREEGERLRKS